VHKLCASYWGKARPEKEEPSTEVVRVMCATARYALLAGAMYSVRVIGMEQCREG